MGSQRLDVLKIRILMKIMIGLIGPIRKIGIAQILLDANINAYVHYACIHTRRYDYVYTFSGFTQYTLTCTYVCMHEAHVFVYV